MLRLYRDDRLGSGRWVLGDPTDALMRIPDQLLRTVAFLCVRPPDGPPQYGGTAFFVATPGETNPKHQHVYLVTARHNLDKVEGLRGEFCLRVTMAVEGAKADFIRLPYKQAWLTPHSDGTDLAALPVREIEQGQCPMSMCALPADMWLTPQMTLDALVGVGDDIVITGLFTQHYGEVRNLPMLRTGIIAGMPSEPLIDDETGEPYSAYIAEVRSIGGLSGSPVLVKLGITRYAELGLMQPGEPSHGLYLLGVVRGHWDVKRRSTGDMTFDEQERREVNMGMALVTPVDELINLLERDDVEKDRRIVEREERRDKRGVTLDSAFATSSDDAEFDRFAKLTRKLVNVPKKELDEKRKVEG